MSASALESGRRHAGVNGGGVTFRAVTSRLVREKTINAGDSEYEDGRRLVADLAFSDALEVKTGRRARDKREVHVGKIRMRAALHGEAAEETRGMNCSMLLAADRLSSGIEARLSVVMPREEFDRLWERSQEGGSLELGGDIGGQTPRTPILIDEQGTIVKYRSVLTHFVQGEIENEDWFSKRRIKAFRDELSEELMREGSETQLETVAQELSRASATSWHDDPMRQDRVLRAREALSKARCGFRRPLMVGTDKGQRNLWSMQPRDFVQNVNALSDEDANKAGRHYERLWQHVEVKALAELILNGGDAEIPELEIDEEVVQQISALMSSDKGMQSETLEWACANALVLRQCLKTLREMPAEDKLRWAQGTGIFKQLPAGKRIAMIRDAYLNKFLVQGMTMITLGVALWQTALPNNVKWMVSVVVFTGHWVRSGVMTAAKRNAEDAMQAMMNIVRLHESLREPDFNARGAREHAYASQRAGLELNRWVLNLLDRRIERGLEPHVSIGRA